MANSAKADVLPTTEEVLLSHLHSLVSEQTPQHADRVTGMFRSMTSAELMTLLGDRNLLRERIQAALNVLNSRRGSGDGTDDVRGERLVTDDVTGERREVKSETEAVWSKEELGSALFSAVVSLDAPLSAQITGMLLELDPDDVLRLLGSPESLAAAVDRARKEYIQAVHNVTVTSPVTSKESSDAHAEDTVLGSSSENEIGDTLFTSLSEIYPRNAPKLTGMLMELGPEKLASLFLKRPSGTVESLLRDCRQALLDTGQWLPEEDTT